MDLFYHGTAVLGVIKKIAPNSKIIVIKCMQNGGRGAFNDILNGLEYAISQKVDIISMSVGTKIHNSDLEKKIKKIVESGISIIVSAGNENDGKSNTREISYPAYYQEVISVGSCNKDGKPSMQDIQYLGALNTYYKRYLYLNAFGITDGEIIDSMDTNDLKEADNTDYRQLLIDFCNSKNLDVTEIAKKNKLNAKSGQKAFKKVLESLGAEECKM